jgi:hypothetical protein
MSDEIRFSIVVSEGPHDVESVGKLLRLKGFCEVRQFDGIPEELRAVIPSHYPVKDACGQLTRFVAHPAFLIRDHYWILLSGAGGAAKLGTNLRDLLSSFQKKYTDMALRGAAVLTDADEKTAPEARNALFQQLSDAFRDSGKFVFNPASPAEIKVYGGSKPFASYIFPDDQNAGTLEAILLEGAGRTYPELLKEAEKYVAYAKTLLYAKNLTSGSNGEKAVVGVIANALRPGKANQVSIHDDDWFTKESLTSLALHQALSEFIDTIIQWGR